MNYKTIQLKADEAGKISGFFSTYDKTPDSYGDIIEPGAFTGTIERRKATGHPFPLCFNHDFSAVIGAIENIEEKENGPYIEGGFLDTQLAQDVRKMCLSGAIWQFSFAYEVLKRREPTEEEKKAGITNVLQEVEVFEISVVTVPANQNAVATEVKSIEPETKQGRRNSRKDADTINKIIDLAKSLLDDEGEDITPDQEEDAKSAEAQPEANEVTTPEEPKDEGNAKRADALLDKITAIKGGSDK
jgi:HK97 family phage prohead protease